MLWSNTCFQTFSVLSDLIIPSSWLDLILSLTRVMEFVLFKESVPKIFTTAHHLQGVMDRSKPKLKSSVGRRGRRRSSNSTIPCPVCGELYSRKDNLRVHQRIHSGEKPFKCNECDSSFRWAGVLRAHQAVHRKQPEESSGTQFEVQKESEAVSQEPKLPEAHHDFPENPQAPKEVSRLSPSRKELTISIEMLLHHDSDEEEQPETILQPRYEGDL